MRIAASVTAIVSVCEFVRRIRAPLGLFVFLFWPAL
jgi:hypothetical protein